MTSETTNILPAAVVKHFQVLDMAPGPVTVHAACGAKGLWYFTGDELLTSELTAQMAADGVTLVELDITGAWLAEFELSELSPAWGTELEAPQQFDTREEDRGER